MAPNTPDEKGKILGSKEVKALFNTRMTLRVKNKGGIYWQIRQELNINVSRGV